MKNIQVIDGAENCTYSIFAADDDEFELIFPNGQDIEFAEDLLERVDAEVLRPIMNKIWQRPIIKEQVQGIHGTLFYELEFKKEYYPTKKEAEMSIGS